MPERLPVRKALLPEERKEHPEEEEGRRTAKRPRQDPPFPPPGKIPGIIPGEIPGRTLPPGCKKEKKEREEKNGAEKRERLQDMTSVKNGCGACQSMRMSEIRQERRTAPA